MKTQKKDLTTVAYDKGINDLLKIVAESGSDVHENYTPAEICDRLLDKVDLTKAENVLVLYNIELLFALMKRKFSGHVTFFTQSKEKAEIASKIFSGLTVEYIDKEANPLYYMENKWPDKFDIVIANPPYGSGDTNTNLDTLFLEKSLVLSKKEIVFVHPAKLYIRDYSIKKDTGGFSLLLDRIGNCLNSLDIFNANDIFGTSLDYPIVIAHFKKEKENSEIAVKNLIYNKEDSFDNIKDINLFGNGKIFSDLKKKIQKISLPNLSSERKKLNRNTKSPGLVRNAISKRWIVRLQAQSGSTFKKGDKTNLLFKNDFFTFFRTNRENDGQLIFDTHVIDDDSLFVLLKGSYLWWEFDTSDECLNFVSYLKLTSTRGFLSLLKIDRNLDSNMFLVPFLDFSKKWNDKKVYKELGISKKEQEFIKEVIPPYYD